MPASARRARCRRSPDPAAILRCSLTAADHPRDHIVGERLALRGAREQIDRDLARRREDQAAGDPGAVEDVGGSWFEQDDVGICVGAGYLFGNVPVVRENFSLVALGIIFVSALPMAIELLKSRRQAA